jgi:hypothetical protein
MTDRDWEAAAAARLQRTIDHLVSGMRATADQIERESAHNIKAAAEGSSQYASYARAAGQAIHEMHSMVVNANASNIVDAAYDADAARQEKQAKVANEAYDVAAAKSTALAAVLGTLDGWIEGQRANHDALDHRAEPVGEECWRRFAPADIRNMVNDAAREVGVHEFTLPKKGRETEV